MVVAIGEFRRLIELVTAVGMSKLLGLFFHVTINPFFTRTTCCSTQAFEVDDELLGKCG